ncbi:MAG: DNA-directed RNA polymerase subunit RpoH/Rpb5 C-terminal domain-containing protein [Candidatus Micrarchaeia archaeon]
MQPIPSIGEKTLGEKAFKHFLLPSVEVEKDPEKVLKRLNLDSAKRFPKVSILDKSVEGLACAPGDIIRVNGKNPVTGKAEEYYRCVTE